MVPLESVTQVEGSRTGLDSHPRGLQPFIRLRRTTTWHGNACSKHFPPVVAREVRHLQNFFPFPQREEEEEVLEDDNFTADYRKDDPNVDPVGFLA